jgi:BTB/POZ domain
MEVSSIKLFPNDRSSKFIDVIASQPPDCYIYVGDVVIEAHKIILAASSKYLQVRNLFFRN